MTNQDIAERYFAECPSLDRLEKLCIKRFAEWLDVRSAHEPPAPHVHQWKDVQRPSAHDPKLTATHSCECGAELCLPEKSSGHSLIVSAEDAKNPGAFRHWSKDDLVPYAGCYCTTCSSAQRTNEHSE